jgi:hypothetical protein
MRLISAKYSRGVEWAAMGVAMPAVHGSDDDFLYQLQAPIELSSANSANEFKNRIITRIRRTRQITYQAPSESASWQAEFLRIFKLYYWPF